MVQAFRLIGNWAVASKGWSTGVSGSLVAETGLQIMMVLDHLSLNDLLSLLLVLDGYFTLLLCILLVSWLSSSMSLSLCNSCLYLECHSRRGHESLTAADGCFLEV